MSLRAEAQSSTIQSLMTSLFKNDLGQCGRYIGLNARTFTVTFTYSQKNFTAMGVFRGLGFKPPR